MEKIAALERVKKYIETALNSSRILKKFEYMENVSRITKIQMSSFGEIDNDCNF